MRKYCDLVFIVLTAMIIAASMASCADMHGPQQPPRQITSCPPPLVLTCESRHPPSKGGAEEEIPQYERCRCERVF